MPYKFKLTLCPHCGHAPIGVLGTIAVRMDLMESDDDPNILVEDGQIETDMSDFDLDRDKEPRSVMFVCSECFKTFPGEETEDSDPCV